MTGTILGTCFVDITEKLIIDTKIKNPLYGKYDLPLLFDHYNGKTPFKLSKLKFRYNLETITSSV
jgi:hypothetical protein